MNKNIEKIDYKKEMKFLWSPPVNDPEIIKVPAFKFIMIDGKGDPDTSKDFQNKIQTLYGLSYTIKFMFKLNKKEPFDYVVLPLEGLWWSEDMSGFVKMEKDEWEWTLMIMQPDKLTEEIYNAAVKKLMEKKNDPLITKAYLKVYKEGLSAQIMHIGPYDEEHTTIVKLHSFFTQKGYTTNGYHHEIYLSDPRRCAPEKLKTIIRQPIKKL